MYNLFGRLSENNLQFLEEKHQSSLMWGIHNNKHEHCEEGHMSHTFCQQHLNLFLKLSFFFKVQRFKIVYYITKIPFNRNSPLIDSFHADCMEVSPAPRKGPCRCKSANGPCSTVNKTPTVVKSSSLVVNCNSKLR